MMPTEDPRPRRRSARVPRRVVCTVLVATLSLLGRGPLSADEERPPSTDAPIVDASAVAVDTEMSGEADEVTEPSSAIDVLTDVLTGGKAKVNLRLRTELVGQDGLRSAEAYTARLRLGYETKAWHGLAAYAELEGLAAADDDLYNAAGVNGQPSRAVVADPPGAELNQLYLTWHEEDTGSDLRVGRQRILFDDARFIGNVGWRQLEQTFDAFLAKSSAGVDGLSLNYAYVWEVNRVFGPDAGVDFNSNSHFVNASYDVWHDEKGATLRPGAFAYVLDFQNAAASSSNTIGLRIDGKRSVTDRVAAAGVASWAYQEDAAENPVDYDAHYFLVEGRGIVDDTWEVGGGFELLGDGDGPATFNTPLATLHAFNGWADVFLSPTAHPNGLQDVYVLAGAKLPWALQAKAFWHWFTEDSGGSQLGHEFDAQLGKKVNDHIACLVKYALFDGKAAGLADRNKVWFQIEIDF